MSGANDNIIDLSAALADRFAAEMSAEICRDVPIENLKSVAAMVFADRDIREMVELCSRANEVSQAARDRGSLETAFFFYVIAREGIALAEAEIKRLRMAWKGGEGKEPPPAG